MRSLTKITKEEYQNAISNYISNLSESNLNFRRLGNIVQITTNGKILIIGDIHGDYNSLMYILKENKDFLKNNENIILFLGDYIDRGQNSVEVLYTIAELGIQHPGQVITLRGNHEISKGEIIIPFDFDRELYFKYGDDGQDLLKYTIETFFEKLPLAAYIKDKIFFVHGGIPIEIPSLDQISKAEATDIIGYQLRWNDPTELTEYYAPSDRGNGIYLFGSKITEEFLNKNKLEMIIRGHQVPREKGYIINHNGKVITIFSAKEPYRLSRASYAIYDPREQKLMIKTF